MFFGSEPLGLGVHGLITSRDICSGHDLNVWQDVLDYWFEPGGEMKWFQGGPQVAKEIQEKFGAIVSYPNPVLGVSQKYCFTYIYARYQHMKGYSIILLKEYLSLSLWL